MKVRGIGRNKRFLFYKLFRDVEILFDEAGIQIYLHCDTPVSLSYYSVPVDINPSTKNFLPLAKIVK